MEREIARDGSRAMKRSQGRRQLARGNTSVNFAPFLRFDIYRRAYLSLMYE